MKKILLISIILTSCSINDNLSNMNSNLKPENLFDLSINQYKKMLKYYNDNNDYPKIDK